MKTFYVVTKDNTIYECASIIVQDDGNLALFIANTPKPLVVNPQLISYITPQI